MKLIRTLSAGFFLVGSAIYLAAEAITAAAWKSPTYSYAYNWISDLGSVTKGVFQVRELDSPLHAVMNSGFIAQGLLFGIGTLLLSRTITGRTRSFTAVMGVVIAIGWATWVALWNGSYDLAAEIIAPEFRIHVNRIDGQSDPFPQGRKDSSVGSNKPRPPSPDSPSRPRSDRSRTMSTSPDNGTPPVSTPAVCPASSSPKDPP